MISWPVFKEAQAKLSFQKPQSSILRTQIYLVLVDNRKKIFSRALFYFFVYFLFILPIIRANYFYVDDISRNLTGFARWTSVGRPLANVVMKTINFNLWTLSDLAPLPQLLAVAVLSVASAWTSMAFRLKDGIALLPMAFIVCNPFFMENLAYRYDALSMALATVLVMIPTALEKKLVGLFLYFSIFASLILALNLYQPAINVFIVLICFMALLNLRQKALFETMFSFFAKLACLAAAMIAYKIEAAFIAFQKYAQQHAKFVSIGAFSAVLRNICHFYRFMARNLLHIHQTQLLLAGIFLGFFLFMANFLRESWSRDRTFLRLIFAGFLIIGMLEGIIGPMVLLQHPVWAPRVLMGFGAVAACALTLLMLECPTGIFRSIAQVLLVAILVAQFSLSYAFGNILIAQSALDSVVANQIVNDAFRMVHDKPSSLVILGKAPEPPNVAREARGYPVLNRLLPSHQTNFWTWGPLLRLHGLPHNIKFFQYQVPDQHVVKQMKTCRFQKISRRLYDNIYSDKANVVVDFSKRCGS